MCGIDPTDCRCQNSVFRSCHELFELFCSQAGRRKNFKVYNPSNIFDLKFKYDQKWCLVISQGNNGERSRVDFITYQSVTQPREPNLAYQLMQYLGWLYDVPYLLLVYEGGETNEDINYQTPYTLQNDGDHAMGRNGPDTSLVLPGRCLHLFPQDAKNLGFRPFSLWVEENVGWFNVTLETLLQEPPRLTYQDVWQMNMSQGYRVIE
ncbi:hypothetical protein IWQ62_000245 [Dispira parvispora]|uniref:Uncharacterized protein n=1 Tax=Dispira parvispora TaxID=1520584 RepID=A0A9W8E693_9FUNG|nr:hypothetical protein IWQ62_000245 [Dispira parvispora]